MTSLDTIKWIHIAGGMIALLLGAVAVAARKGGSVHVSAGTWFCVAMFVLGVTASILAPFKSPPDSPIGGIMACYFVATAWMTARRHSGTPGRFEKIACAIVLVIAVAIIGDGFKHAFAPPGQFSGPPGPGALFAIGGICLVAGLADLRFVIRGNLSATQRISRHLWRMCFAFFIATGSFFLGQQKVLPQAMRGSPILFVLAFAPLALMFFWLVRVRFSKVISALTPLDAVSGTRVEAGDTLETAKQTEA
jgi:hypothetical protein